MTAAVRPSKRQRELIGFLRELGCRDVRIVPSGKHRWVTFTTPDGRPERYLSAISPGSPDQRADRARLRRLAQPPAPDPG